ncbi:hypothetical protein EUTSA_v10023835mg, partial [Eutrema salsugineum]
SFSGDINPFPVYYSPECDVSVIGDESFHRIFHLLWSNNEKFNVDDSHIKCICHGSNLGTYYYFCVHCKQMYHKECVESPIKITHPYHPEHSLQLYYLETYRYECFCCGKSASRLVYSCTICQVFMDPVCAMKLIPLVIEKPKTHDHPLTFFPRQTCLTCNVCGLLRKIYPTYVCLKCNYVAHNDFMYSPHIIKISRHHHRLSYTSSLQSREWSCGVCRQCIDGGYGAYTCDKCSDYVVRSRCALGKNVCDGEELEGVPEDDDITQDERLFIVISEGVILHFLHGHHLRLEISMLYDENKLCQACVLPIFEGNFYTCMECDFILHETCAKSCRRIQHVLHPYPLTLKLVRLNEWGHLKLCEACFRYLGGFIYRCDIGESRFNLDVRCASVSEPFDYEGHEHPLFLSLDQNAYPICHICKEACLKQLNCITCNFICATIPYKAMYKHDRHFLKILCGEEVCEKVWCEICERDLSDTNTKVFYWCDECCTTVHIECLFGKDSYMKPGQFLKPDFKGKKTYLLPKSNISQPLCNYCKNPYINKVFKIGSYQGRPRA